MPIQKQDIDRFRRWGFHLIPLRKEPYPGYIHDPKKPLAYLKEPLRPNWVQESLPDSVLVPLVQQGHGVGAALGRDHLVIDVDIREDLNGLESLYRLWEPHKVRPELNSIQDIAIQAPISQTGGGGLHIFFQMENIPGKVHFREILKEYPGLEFKKFGRQVVMPGSMHPSGFEYRWDRFSNFNTSHLPLAPRWLIEKIRYQAHTFLNSPQTIQCEPEKLAEILADLDVTKFDSNAIWFQIMGSAHQVTCGTGLEEFLQWSLSDPRYANEESRIRTRWESLDTNKIGNYGIGTLDHYHVEATGRSIRRKPINEVFRAYPDWGTQMAQRVLGVLDTATVLENPAIIEDHAARVAMTEAQNTIRQDAENTIREAVQSGDVAVLARTVTMFKGSGIFRRAYEVDAIVKEEKAKIRRAEKEARDKAKQEEKAAAQKLDIPMKIADSILSVWHYDGFRVVLLPNKKYYTYNGQFWEEYPETLLKKRIRKTAERINTPDGLEVFGFENPFVYSVHQPKVFTRLTESIADESFLDESLKSVVNCTNCELWLDDETGGVTVKEHKADHHLVTGLKIDYDPAATCPMWDKAILEIFADKANPADHVRHLEEVIGYLIQTNKNIPSWFMLYGGGSNGKSQVLKVIEALAHEDNVMTCGLDSTGNNHFTSDLPGKLLWVEDDIPTSRLPEAWLKKLSETKLTQINPKGTPMYNAWVMATPIYAGNSHPQILDTSFGFSRRVFLIEFTRTFEGVNDDKSLFVRIRESELAGILNRALLGLQRVRNRGDFLEPEECKKAKKDWIVKANPVLHFLHSRDLIKPGYEMDMEALYMNWRVSPYHLKNLSFNLFEKILNDAGFKTYKPPVGRVKIQGVYLNEAS